MTIKIRHSEKGDIPAIKSIYEQPSCYAGTLQLPYPSFEKWNKFLNNVPDNFHSLVAVRCSYMNQIQLKDTYDALKFNQYEITIPEEIRLRAYKSVERMLQIG